MTRKLIDISVPLQNDVPADPPGGHPTIQYIDHQQGLPRMLQFFDGLKKEDLPDGQGWAVEQVNLSTHNGTHLDAPYHFHPTMNRGERSWTIDEVPLDWCLQPGVKLDFRHFPDGYVATAADVEAELKRIGHTLKPLEIVVVNTSAGVKYGQPDYVTSGCGMGYEATMYLLERGVKLEGVTGFIDFEIPQAIQHMVQIIRTLDAYAERLGPQTGGDRLPEDAPDTATEPPPAGS